MSLEFFIAGLGNNGFLFISGIREEAREKFGEKVLEMNLFEVLHGEISSKLSFFTTEVRKELFVVPIYIN